EGAHAVLVAQERFPVRRVVLVALVTGRTRQKLFFRQRRLRAIASVALRRNPAHVVDAELARKQRVAPRRARRLPLGIVVEGDHGLGRNGTQLGGLGGWAPATLRERLARDDE